MDNRSEHHNLAWDEVGMHVWVRKANVRHLSFNNMYQLRMFYLTHTKQNVPYEMEPLNTLN